MNKPLISIIITVLNGAKTISQCLESIDCQSYKEYEVVIVDGGSTDRTVELIHASPIVNLKVHVVPGLGLYAGLNKGIRLSEGKWLYFLGCDDALYSADTLQKVAEVLLSESNKAKVIVGNVESIKHETLLRSRFGSPYWMQYHVHHQAMFYDRSIFEHSLYDETMRIASDYEFNLRLALDNVPHRYIDMTICNFGGDGISENQARQGFVEMQEIHKRLFHGAGRQWVLSYFWLKQNIIITRNRFNLINLKARFRRYIKRQVSFM